MCGICGWAGRVPSKHFDSGALQKMTRSIEHRGPDAEGFFEDSVWYRRQSIFDIEHGDQPFYSLSGRHVVVYNAPELRANLESRGYPFKTYCDTEVITFLANHLDLKFVNMLEGIFAFALWDCEEKRLLPARDGLGVKPLIYRIDPDGIRFASELKFLYADFHLSWTVNPQVLHHYLGLNYIPSPFTIYKEAKKLGRGEIIEWRLESMNKSVYWEPPKMVTKVQHKEEVGERVHVLLRE